MGFVVAIAVLFILLGDFPSSSKEQDEAVHSIRNANNNGRRMKKLKDFLTNPIFTASVIDMTDISDKSDVPDMTPSPTVVTSNQNNEITASMPSILNSNHLIDKLPTITSSSSILLPVHDYYPLDLPNKSDKSYPNDWFNYNPNDSNFGPEEWKDISAESDNNIYLQYLDNNNDKDDNTCNDDRMTSPVNLVDNGQCEDDHRPALNRGRNKFKDLEFLILPSTLRIITTGADQQRADRAPKSDFSNLSFMIPIVFVNIKIPSEHLLFGKQYKGEIQMYHLNEKDDGRKKFVVTSILIDDFDDKENIQLEQLIREFEEASWKKKNECIKKYLNNIPAYNRTYPILTPEEMIKVWGTDNINKADIESKSDYDLHRLTTTGWYCGYEGSVTEPPCLNGKVHWRVLDVPLKISKTQLQRMKDVLFNRLNDNCQYETAAYNNTVNRPIDIETTNKNVWCCTSENWEYLDHRNPTYWLSQWDLDYHGWKSIEVLKNKTWHH